MTYFAPIEAWVGDQDLSAGDEQSEERNNREPVRHSHQESMSGTSRALERNTIRHGGRITRLRTDRVISKYVGQAKYVGEGRRYGTEWVSFCPLRASC